MNGRVLRGAGRGLAAGSIPLAGSHHEEMRYVLDLRALPLVFASPQPSTSVSSALLTYYNYNYNYNYNYDFKSA